MKKGTLRNHLIVISTLLSFFIFSPSFLYAQPANDDLCNAAPIVLGASCMGIPNANVTNATAQPGEPVASCFSGGTNSAWFSFVAPASGLITINTDFGIGTNTDTEIALYELPGGNCNMPSSLVEVACSQDISFSNFFSFIPATIVTPGQTYYVSASGWNGTQGTFCLVVTDAVPPVNDSLCNAISLVVDAGCNGMTNGDNTNATAEAGEPLASCFVGGPNSVWYSFVAPNSGLVNINTDNGVGTNTDTEIALYSLTGGNCNMPSGLVQIDCDQDVGSGNFLSTIGGATVTPGQTYYVQVSGWDGTEGTFCVTVDEVNFVANDSLCNAVPLAMGVNCNGTPNGDNASAGFQGGEPMASCTNDVNTVWYSFVGPPSGFVNLRTDTFGVGGTNPLTSMGLFLLPGGDCNTVTDLVEIACAANNGFAGASFDSLTVTPGDMYYVQVAGGNGTFCIEIDEVNPSFNAPINDSLCNAFPLIVGGSCNPNNPNGNNTGATFQINEPVGSCFNGGANSIWYTFLAPPSGFVNITTNLPVNVSPQNFDTEIALYTLPNGDCFDLTDLTEIDCNQDFNNNTTRAQLSVVPVTPGLLYFIQVSGNNGAQGAFCIEVESTAPPVNDNVCNALVLPVDGTTITSVTNLGASTQTGEDQLSIPQNGGTEFDGWTESVIDNSLWYTFTAPASGSVFIDLCNATSGGTTDFDTQVAVFSTTDCNDFTTFSLEGANDNAIICQNPFASYLEVYCLTPGETFYVLVDGYEGEAGMFDIRLGEISKPLTLNSVVIDPLCTSSGNGGIQVVGDGGGGDYSFVWNNGSTDAYRPFLSVGTYTVTLEDACDSMITESFILSGPTDLMADAGNDVLACEDATITLGGTMPGMFGEPIRSEQGFYLNSSNQSLNTLKLKDPVGISTISTSITTPISGADFINGTLYVIDGVNNNLVTIDTASGMQAIVGSVTGLIGHSWSGLAYNEATSTLYGLSFINNPLNGEIATQLYTIEPTSGSTTPGMAIDGLVSGFAIDNGGLAYGINTLNSRMVSIDLMTGTTTDLGPTGYTTNTIQKADFDPETNTYYVFNPLNDGSATLRMGNTSNGATIPFINLNGTDVGGFAIAKSSVAPYQYLWTPVAGLSDSTAANPEAVASGVQTYVLQVTDECQSITDTVTITASAPPLASPTTTPSNGTSNGTATANASGGIAPYTYQWNNGETTEMITGLDSGVYSVTVTDSLGCMTNAVAEVGSNVSIDKLLSAGINSLHLYPNPTRGLINIELELTQVDQVNISVWDIRGQRLIEISDIQSVNYRNTLDLKNLPNGVYLLKIATTKGEIHKRITRL